MGMTRGALPRRRIETQGARNRKVYKVKETLPTPHVLLVRLCFHSDSNCQMCPCCASDRIRGGAHHAPACVRHCCLLISSWKIDAYAHELAACRWTRW